MQDIDVRIFQKFDQQWALLTAGQAESFNTMTISWGGLGTLWGKPVATVYVKPIRYTYEYMEKNDYFTVSFYPQAYKKDLAVLGSLSGRDTDKLSQTTLTIQPLDRAVTFQEAELTLVCRKIYCQDLILDSIPEDAVKRYYQNEPAHRMYIGEVVDIIKK